MTDDALTAAADLALVERLRAELQERNDELHQRNNQLAAAQFSLELAYDDIKRAIAMLPAEPGAALGVLVSSVRAQNASQAAQEPF